MTIKKPSAKGAYFLWWARLPLIAHLALLFCNYLLGFVRSTYRVQGLGFKTRGTCAP
jgi:hypothetical protein